MRPTKKTPVAKQIRRANLLCLIYVRSSYDGDAVSESRTNTVNNNTYQISNNGATQVVSYGSSPQSPFAIAYTLLLKKATQAFIDKQYDKCIELCDNMLGINRDGAEAYFLKGAANYGLDKKDISIKFFTIAANLGSKDAEYLLEKLQK
jgi:hypothetical protein